MNADSDYIAGANPLRFKRLKALIDDHRIAE
jgi:hypothetical protein